MKIFDVNGDVLSSDFSDNISVFYGREYDTNYSLIRINQTKKDGSKMYPFLRYNRMSALELANLEKWEVTSNCGLGWSASEPIDGIVIQNGVVIQNTPATHHEGAMPLTIDANGNLGYASADADANELVANGIVSACCGFGPLIVDYADYNDAEGVTYAQRKIVGQFGNGDYAIITCEGRDFDNSTGWIEPQMREVCKKHGLKFAYNCDGGGSTATVIGKKQLNTIYEGTYGRATPVFFVFNGSDHYFIPSEH